MSVLWHRKGSVDFCFHLYYLCTTISNYRNFHIKNMSERLFSKTFSLKPGESNGQQEMSLPFLAGRLIEVASLHAESWDIGYTTLIKNRMAWVLSRLVIEMYKYPNIGENYVLQTWIESYNHRFSARNFAVLDGDSCVCGYARTIWVVLDLDTRRSVDMSTLNNLHDRILEKPCPIEPATPIRVNTDVKRLSYPVRYSDIDLNRHVNSMRYIEHILDLYPFEWYDMNRVTRFEMAFAQEARPGIDIDVYEEKKGETEHCIELRHVSDCLCRSRIIFAPREMSVSLPFGEREED